MKVNIKLNSIDFNQLPKTSLTAQTVKINVKVSQVNALTKLLLFEEAIFVYLHPRFITPITKVHIKV